MAECIHALLDGGETLENLQNLRQSIKENIEGIIMAYIGRSIDTISNVEKLDTVAFDGSQSYTLQKDSSNFTPSGSNNLLISIDGVIQAGNFTVSRFNCRLWSCCSININ